MGTSMQRRQPQATSGLITLQDDPTEGDEVEMHSGPSLPEDILCHIHSFMPMRDAARAACVSHAFLRSWRCHSNLNFSKETLGLNENACGKDAPGRVFYSKVDHILKKHSGIGLKKLKILIDSDYSAKDSRYLNSWLRIAVAPGIEELTLILVPFGAKYNFPCSLLSDGSGDSIQYLHLARCSFRPTATLGGLRSLTRLHLCLVRITGDELVCFLTHSPALERLELRSCDKIVCLKVPRLLQRLNYLEVSGCAKLKVIENEAPNVSSFAFGGGNSVQLSLGETLQMKSLSMSRCGSIFYARAELPSSMPNLEALTVHSHTEVWQRYMKNVSVFADPADLRQMRGLQHHKLRSVSITGFSSAKSLVELTRHILESITSLECLTLETPQSSLRCSDRCNKSGKCSPLAEDLLMEGRRAVLAIRRFIEPKVPSTVKLRVLEPCGCHAV
ncbi:unnamed protein product [Urochloa decumbens]|uniref:F-box domain-containing protein n=1 Tax=Urochloa decumbens TaxID=240449 RepID=A0ABC8W869_9POAL